MNDPQVPPPSDNAASTNPGSEMPSRKTTLWDMRHERGSHPDFEIERNDVPPVETAPTEAAADPSRDSWFTFIGGPLDGQRRRIARPHHIMEVRIPNKERYGFTACCYVLEFLCYGEREAGRLYRFKELNGAEALRQMIATYGSRGGETTPEYQRAAKHIEELPDDGSTVTFRGVPIDQFTREQLVKLFNRYSRRFGN